MKKNWITIIKVAAAFGILTYIFRTTPLSDILKALSQAFLPLVLIGLCFDPVSMLLNALNMKMLLTVQAAAMRVRSILRINFITEFYGFFLPGLISSGLIRWHQFSRACGKPAEVLTTILYVRLWDTVMTLAVGLLFWVLDPVARSHESMGLLLALSGCVGLGIVVSVFNPRLSAYVRARIRPGRFMPAALVSRLCTLIDSTARFGNARKRVLAITLLIVLARQALGLMTFSFFAYALGMRISIVSLGWTYSMLSIVLIMPITFSGIGVREGSLILLLDSYGVPAASAVALSWLLFFNVFMLRVIGGVLEGGRFLFRKYGAHGYVRQAPGGTSC